MQKFDNKCLVGARKRRLFTGKLWRDAYSLRVKNIYLAILRRLLRRCQDAKLTKNAKNPINNAQKRGERVNIIYPILTFEWQCGKRVKIAEFDAEKPLLWRCEKMRQILGGKRFFVKLCELVRHLTRTGFYDMILQ